MTLSVAEIDMERFNLKKLSELKVRKQYQVEMSERFAALENSDDSEDINKAWEDFKKNIKVSARERLGHCEWKEYEPCFDEYSQFLGQRK
jgi:hypothetical protein